MLLPYISMAFLLLAGPCIAHHLFAILLLISHHLTDACYFCPYHWTLAILLFMLFCPYHWTLDITPTTGRLLFCPHLLFAILPLPLVACYLCYFAPTTGRLLFCPYHWMLAILLLILCYFAPTTGCLLFCPYHWSLAILLLV